MTDQQKHIYVIFAAAAADQISKVVVQKVLPVHTNSGISFGLLRGVGAFLPTICSAAFLFCAYIILKSRCSKRTMTGVALMAGGVLGNLADRIWLGHVIDWIYLPLSIAFFPNGLWFNIADVCLSVGALLAVCGMFRQGDRSGE